MEAKTGFEPRLESMRGIAALIVAAHHGITTFAARFDDLGTVPGAVFQMLMEEFSNPGMAVLFFFVLSGYVLGRSLERDGNYVRFTIRRAFRILPAFVVAVLFGYACITLFRIDIDTPGISAFFKKNFWPELSLGDLRDNFLFRQTRADGPTWSIYWEIVGSLLLPAVVLAHRYLPRMFDLPLFILITIAVLMRNNFNLRMLEYFYAGFLLPPIIARLMPSFWLVRLATFLLGYWLVLIAGRLSAFDNLSIVEGAAGGALMIGAVISSKDFLSWLTWRPFRFLGRVSYSFYLLHTPIFYLTAVFAVRADIFPRTMVGNFAIAAISVAISLPLSALVYAVVEKAGIEVGRRLTSRQLYCTPVPVPPATLPGK